MIWRADANSLESGSLLHNNFPVCSWICKSGASWHLILWEPWQMCLGISHFNRWI